MNKDELIKIIKSDLHFTDDFPLIKILEHLDGLSPVTLVVAMTHIIAYLNYQTNDTPLHE